MFGRFGIAAAAAAVITVLGVCSAAALEIIPESQYGGDTVPAALMEPINPFVSNTAQNTTSVLQFGTGNTATSGVSGGGNLSMISQSGHDNRAVHAIQGNSSALLLVQGGSNNDVVQVSRGNRNLQLVGVSGSNNQIAYVQTGNDLAGALDVRNSQNSTVLAIQTPQSARYLMPSGLRGLTNATVVIVPGRMYVMPKR